MPIGYDGLPPSYIGKGSPLTPNLGLSLAGMDPTVAENFWLIDVFAAGGGGGGSVNVNGSQVTNPNFNGTTPAAPGGNVNVTWQVSGSSVSAYVPLSSGTVSSFSSGNLSPLFTTSVATPTTTPALTFTLSNAGGGTVFGNNTTSAAAPSYTIAPVLGIPGTSTGTIALASSTASGKYTLTAPANAATPTLTLPTTSNVLAGQLAGDGVIYASSLQLASAAGTLTIPTPQNQTANTVFAGPTSGGAAAPTFRALVSADIPSGAVLWNQIGNASGALTLANAGNATTFNQTSPVNWTWANTTPATFSGTAGFVASRVWTGTSASSAINTTGANLLVAVICAISGTSISDSKGNTWNFLPNFSGANSSLTRIAYAFNATVGSGHTFTLTGGTAPFGIVYAFSGMVTDATVLNASTGLNTQANTGFVSASVVPTGAAVIVSGFGCDNATNGMVSTINEGFSTPDTQAVTTSECGSASYLLTGISGTTYNPTWTITNNGKTVGSPIAAFLIGGTQTNSSSPVFNLNGTYWNGTASATDSWTIQNVVGTNGVDNSNSTLTVSHNGSTGNATLSIPSISSAVTVMSLTLANAATSQSSPNLSLQGNYWNGTVSSTDSWAIQNIISNGTNGASALTFVHSGSSGSTSLALPSATTIAWNSDTGLSRISAGVVGIGNGSAGNITGNLQLGTITSYGGTATVSQGVPSEIVTVDLTAQSAAISATNLIASAPRSGMYRISWSADITTADGSSSTLGGANGFQVVFTSPTDSVVKTTVAGNSITSAANTTGTALGGSIIVYAKTGTAIQYQYGYTSNTPGQMVYELHIKLEAL
jgi:hypothetical protein